VASDSPVMAAFTVRTGMPDDIEPTLLLACQADPEFAEDHWRAALEEDQRHPARLLLVAVVAGEVVGYGRASRFEHSPGAPADIAPEGYYLTGVFVHVGQRRTGIGLALTEERLAWIAERADEAWYFANARNVASIELHRRLGFEEVTRRFSVPRLAFEGGEGILFRSRLQRFHAA
jgi:ribosomal protein S18 acetylase RimI-like enzyme